MQAVPIISLNQAALVGGSCYRSVAVPGVTAGAVDRLIGHLLQTVAAVVSVSSDQTSRISATGDLMRRGIVAVRAHLQERVVICDYLVISVEIVAYGHNAESIGPGDQVDVVCRIYQLIGSRGDAPAGEPSFRYLGGEPVGIAHEISIPRCGVRHDARNHGGHDLSPDLVIDASRFAHVIVPGELALVASIRARGLLNREGVPVGIKAIR